MLDDKPLNCGVRQVGPSLLTIDHLHVQRYAWAAAHCVPGKVLDVGCGCGYGSAILAGGNPYYGMDHSPEAIGYAREHYGRCWSFDVGDAQAATGRLAQLWANIVALEVLEHLPNHEAALDVWANALIPNGRLIVSIPQNAIPARKHGFHVRDWTAAELTAALTTRGLRIVADAVQDRRGKFYDGQAGPNDRAVIVAAERPAQTEQT